MFSGFASRLTGWRSPKTLLASFLASALSEFFYVEPELIESNLLSGTKILLKSLKLKELRIEGTNLCFDGVVSQVEFSWVWGGDEKTSFIRETVLTVRGAHIRVKSSVDPNVVSPGAAFTNAGAVNQTQVGYLKRNIQQVIDHMTLNIDDINLVVELNNTPESLHIQTESMCLVSLGRTDKGDPMATLSQRVSFHQLSAHIVDKKGTQHVLLEPFGYAARVARTSGRRFLDGILNGIEMTGQILHGTLALHVGPLQASVLSSLVETSFQTKKVVENHSTQADREVVDAPTSDVEESSTESSTVILPLPSIVIVLDDGGNIRFPDCTFRCRMDGSVCTLEGTKGVILNEVSQLVRLEEGAKWSFDAVSYSMSIKSSNKHVSSGLARMTLDETHMKRLLLSLLAISEATATSVLNEMEHVLVKELENWQDRKETTVLNFAWEGPVTMRIQGELGEFIEASIGRSCVNITPRAAVRRIESGKVDVGPTSFGDIQISIPHATFAPESNLLRLDSPIKVALPSSETLQNFSRFFSRLLSLKQRESNPIPHISSTAALKLPFGIAIPEIFALVADQGGSAILQNVDLSTDGAIQIAQAQVQQADALNMLVRGIQVDSAQQRMTLKCIESLHVDGLIKVPDPVVDILVQVDNGAIKVNIDHIRVSTCEPRAPDRSLREHSASVFVLPCPVHVQLDKLRVDSSSLLPASIVARSIDCTLESEDSTLKIRTRREVKVRLEKANDEWLQASVGQSFATLDTSRGNFVLNEAHTTKVQVGPTSFGHCVLTSPAITVGKKVVFSGGIALELESQQTSESVFHFLQSLVMQTSPKIEEGQGSSFNLPVHIPEFSVQLAKPSSVGVKVVSLNLNNSVVWCESVELVEASGIKALLTGLQTTVREPFQGHLEKLESLHIPGVLNLSEPLLSTNFTYRDDGLVLSLSSLSFELHKPRPMDRQPAVSTAQTFGCLNVKIQFETFKTKIGESLIKAESLDAFIRATNETIEVSSSSSLPLRLETAVGQWLDTTLGLGGGFTVGITRSQDGWIPASASCAGIRVGPCSLGALSVEIPMFHLKHGSRVLTLDKRVNASISSHGVWLGLRQMFDPLVNFFGLVRQKGASEMKLLLREALVQFSSPLSGKVVVNGFSFDGQNNITLERLMLTTEDGTSAALSGITSTLEPMFVSVEWTEAFHVPTVCSLEKPMQGASVLYDGNAAKIMFPKLQIAMLAGQRSQGKTLDKPQLPLPIPFPINLSVGEMAVRPSQSAKSITSLHTLRVGVAAKPLDPFIPNDQQPAETQFSVSVAIVGNEMMSLRAMSVTGVIFDADASEVRNLHVSTKSGTVLAGFSSVDWSSLTGGKEGGGSLAIPLPFSCVEQTALTLEYKGVVVGTTTTVQIPKFVGGPQTTSKDIVRHFNKTILKKAPSFLANTKVLGTSTSDIAASTAGIAAMGSSLTGGVTGLIAVDSVRGAVAAGKKSRGATADDSYKFGDFTRGSLRSIRDAAKSGAELRRGDSSEYRVGDWTTGTAASASQYASSNKSRLAGTGGSAVGMIVGTALLGPVGLVAGTIAGGMAGARAFKDDKIKDEDPVDQTGRKLALEQGESVDLLGINEGVTASNNTSSPAAHRQPHQQQSHVSRSAVQTTHTSATAVQQSGSSQHFFHDFGASTSTSTTSQSQYYAASSSEQSLNTHQQVHSHQSRNQMYTHHSQNQTMAYPQGGQDQQAHLHSYQQRATTTVTQTTTTWQYASSTSHQPPNQHTFQQRVPPIQQQQQQQQCVIQQRTPPRQQKQPQSSYRFGDLTRSVITRGKEKDGRDAKDGYKFGDFTRGLFK